MKKVWMDYRGGTIERSGQRQYFYANVYDEQGNLVGLDCCFREATRVNNKVTYHGPGYKDYFSNEIVASPEEFAAWDANWLKRIS